MKKRGVHFRLISNSRAQVAIFIVTALVLFIAGALYFYYQRVAFEEKIEVVPPEAAPIHLYVNNCIKNVAEEGLISIGLTGGFIDVPEIISGNPRAYFSALPASGFKMPYWWYDGIGSVPSLEFIRQQLVSNLNTEFKNCVNNFEAFADKFEVNALERANFDVQFNEDDVSISLDYPLEIVRRDGNFRTVISQFEYKLPIRFKKAYELATQIMERENNENFLERRTIDLLSMDAEIPTTDLEATCNAKIWQLSGIKSRIGTLLRVNLPYIRIVGTSYNPDLYVPNPSGESKYSQSYFQQHFVWNVNESAGKRYSNMKVAFAYENRPLELYARPSQSGLLTSNSQKGTDMLSFFCLHIWHFTYDLSYPVIVTVIDQASESNMRYQFNFAFKVSIDHNQPNRIRRGSTLFEDIPDLSSEEYCSNLQNEITLYTVNNATGEDIKDVNLTFICGGFYCDMGQSDWLSFGAAAGITKRFPYCVNGIVKATKEGFFDAKSFIQTDLDGRTYALLLNPVKEFQSYRVVKHLLSNPGAAIDLGSNEKASILIRGKDIGHETFAVYPGESAFPLRIAVRDATYEVLIYVLNDENIVGGYIGDWKITKDQLNNAKEIVFHVIEQEQASEDGRALFISGLSSYSKNVPGPELR